MGGAGLPPDDAEVLASAACGEAWALTVLYRRHQPALVRFLAGLAGDDAEDLAAETWIDASRALPTFAGDEQAFRSLLFTIGRRRAIDRLRQRRRRRTEATDPARLPEAVPTADVAQAVVEADASLAAVRRIARLLPRDQAEVVLLRVVGGLGVGEVAEIVGRSRAAVSVLQTRGLQRLARSLRAEEHAAPPAGLAASPQVGAHSRALARFLQDPGPEERWDG